MCGFICPGFVCKGWGFRRYYRCSMTYLWGFLCLGSLEHSLNVNLKKKKTEIPQTGKGRSVLFILNPYGHSGDSAVAVNSVVLSCFK